MQVRDPGSIRRAREARGLSQRDLARLADCSQPAVSMIERGRMTGLSDGLAMGIARRLGVPWEDLFARPGDRAVPNVASAKRSAIRRSRRGRPGR